MFSARVSNRGLVFARESRQRIVVIRNLSCLSLIASAALFFGGCATRGTTRDVTSEAASTPKAESLPSVNAASKPARPARSQSTESPRPPQQTATPVSLPPAMSASVAQRTAAEIRGKYSISIPSADVLLVRRTDVEVQPSALFEEAIALGRVRSRLKGSADLPADIADQSRISDGTVTIPFGTNTSPDRAAEAISMVLAVDGVQRVRAVFSNSR